jgi:hypothetical protein
MNPKSTILSALILLLTFNVFSQNVGINTDGSQPDNSAMLDVKSSDKGFLPPRLSSVQISHISNPAEGLMVYNTDQKKIIYFNGTDWLYLNDDPFFEIPTNGLVAYFPFNGNAVNGFVGGNDGTLVGPILTNDRFGNTDRAYSFDGYNDHILVPHYDALNCPDAVTMSVWVKKEEQNQNWACILLKGRVGDVPNTQNYYLGFVKSYVTGASNSFYSGNDNCQGQTVTSYPTNSVWYHVVGILNYDGEEMIYVNGTKINLYDNSQTNLHLPLNDYFLQIGIGNEGDTNQEHFSGCIDDIRLYNRALTEHEIQSLYKEK